MKGMLTRKAMDYTLNQWDTLTGYCERGDLQISNVLAEKRHPALRRWPKSLAVRRYLTGRKRQCYLLFSDRNGQSK
jgi:hypothetical protein